MAVYKNREVGVIGPNPQANTPDTINIRYKDGTHENVQASEVRFTEDEKKSLIKNHPSKFDNVSTTTEEDLKAVRLGVTPPSDPSFQTQAEVSVQHEKQKELAQKNLEAAKKDAEKKLEKDQVKK